MTSGTQPETALRNVVVGIGALAVSSDAGARLVTYALGSCLGVVLYDPVTHVGGLVHCRLPLSNEDPAKAKELPETFVDTGFAKLLQQVLRAGGERGRLICKIAGCGAPLDDKGIFKVGERNYTVAKRVAWKNNLLIRGELVGGTTPKTLSLELATGRTLVRTSPTETVEI